MIPRSGRPSIAAASTSRCARASVRSSRNAGCWIPWSALNSRRAARFSMQINLGKNTLDTLERELLPVAVGNPQKPLYRRLLVELYGAMTLPLVQRARHEGGTSPAAEAAKAELAKIGSRAVKPLLDALADDKESQQKIAIEVLAYVQNKSAGPALYNYATGQADKSLRVRAMIACGALRDPSILLS